MPEVLRQGSRGEEVRRLQKNLNAAIGRRYGTIAADGVFGPNTKQAVERYQKDFQLKSVDGIVGPETRNALATRVLIIEGMMSRSNSSPLPLPLRLAEPGSTDGDSALRVRSDPGWPSAHIAARITILDSAATCLRSDTPAVRLSQSCTDSARPGTIDHRCRSACSRHCLWYCFGRSALGVWRRIPAILQQSESTNRSALHPATARQCGLC